MKKALFNLVLFVMFFTFVSTMRSADLLRITQKNNDHSKMADKYLSAIMEKNDFSSRVYSANLDYIRGCHRDALKKYFNVLDVDLSNVVDSDLGSLYFNIGYVSSKLGDRDEAIKFFEMALQKKPSDEECCFFLGKQFQIKNDLSKALSFYEKALQIKPNYVQVLVEVGQIFTWQDKPDKAISYLLKACEIKKEDTNILFKLADTSRLFQKYDKAKEAYKKILDIDKCSTKAWYHLGWIYCSERKMEKGVFCYSKVLELEPGHVDAEFGMSKAYLELGAYQDVVINNASVRHGERYSDDRYEFIKDFVAKYNRPITVLDFGASEGYFSFRLARNFKDSVFVMLEPKRILCDLCKLNHEIENVIFLQKAANVSDLLRLGECEHFDVVLALSVVHWFGPLWKEAVDAVLALGDNIIIDVPPAGDSGAIGAKYHKDLNDYLDKKGKVIAKGQRHTTSHLKLLSNTYLIEQKKEDIKKVHWLWDDHREKKDFYKIESSFDTKSLLKPDLNDFPNRYRVQWLPGINLVTFKMLNGVYPTQDMIEKQMLSFQDVLAKDFKLYNLIVQGNNLALIDQDDPRFLKMPVSKECIDRNIELLNMSQNEITVEKLKSAKQ
ncbi:tetratricopeptide repeat protein [bacterium]|jgi:tetratricopeptide (TPR) repeat protein|nr:tetratricopeptide repeat protein [bacterium]